MLFDTLRSAIFSHLKSLLPEDHEIVLEVPPDPEMGDFAFPTFRLAKALRKAPPIIATELAQKCGTLSLFEAKPMGPYLNFFVKPETLRKEVLKTLLTETPAQKVEKAPPTVVLEYSSPNVAKPFNIYHLRGTMIGNCLSRVFKRRGFNVISINHLGDWGTQFGALVLGYEKWGNFEELEKRGIPYLVELYVRINKEMESDESLAKQARVRFASLEKGEEKIKKTWQNFVDLSLKTYKKTYERLGVNFDYYWGESFYIDKIPSLEKELSDNKLVVESEGAQVVMLGDMPPCIIRKQDGSTIYHTRDLAAALYRYEQFHFDKMVYVVGGEQRLHFAQIFKVLELLKKPWAKNCVHVDFGLYRFKDAKMSTRKGNFVTMEAVLDMAVEAVEKLIDARTNDSSGEAKVHMNDEEKKNNAEIIGVGAVIYNDLATDRNHDVNFDLETIIDFEGETGPYIQYAHTRCLSILRSAKEVQIDQLGKELPNFVDLLTQKEELNLIRILARFPIILDQVVESYRPSHLASYLIDVTKVFNAFYRSHKVLVDELALSKARLSLVSATQRVLYEGTSLLGMRLPQKM
ncbi:MAG: arginine--tRNA ligase [Bacteriovoracia bacterium]